MLQMLQLTGLSMEGVKSPPLWAHGHHLCRNTEHQEGDFRRDIEEFSNTMTSDLTISYDSDCIGESLMRTAFDTYTNTYQPGEFEDLGQDFELLKRLKL